MDETPSSLVENVVQYSSAGGSLATIGYQMLKTIVGDIGVDSSSTLSSDSSEEEGSANIMDSPKSHVLSKHWFWGQGGSSSTPSKQKYSSVFGLDKESALPLFTLNDVSSHDMYHDCWIVLYDRVYDITGFLSMHPGGDDVMLEYAGRDATLAFRSVGHSKEAEEMLKPYLIGILVENERIWTRFFNMKSDIP